MKHFTFLTLASLFLKGLLAQESLQYHISPSLMQERSTYFTSAKNPLKASLYSTILPGLGQAYNRKFWKIPIVWGAIGSGIGFISFYNDRYQRLRSAYIAELQGLPHEFSNIPQYTKEVLARAQDNERRFRDYAIAITALLYVLNIIDAAVDAHLFEMKFDKDISLAPAAIPTNNNKWMFSPGLSIHLNF